MNKNTVNVEYEYSDEDLSDILCDGLEGGIGYWATLYNNTPEWKNAKKELIDKSSETDYAPTYEEIMLQLFNTGKSVKFEIDDEQGIIEKIVELTKEKFLKGISLYIKNGGTSDVYEMDSDSGDQIFQYAFFNEVIYG